MFGLPFHHIGLACGNVERTAEYIHLNFSVLSDSGTVFDPLQNAHVRIFNAGLPGAIELVSGAAVEQLVRRQITYYHVCYTTPDLDRTVQHAQELGASVVSEPKPAVLFGGRRVAFVFTPLGLVEFLEEKTTPTSARAAS